MELTNSMDNFSDPTENVSKEKVRRFVSGCVRCRDLHRNGYRDCVENERKTRAQVKREKKRNIL